jgi:hypothetical protein
LTQQTPCSEFDLNADYRRSAEPDAGYTIKVGRRQHLVAGRGASHSVTMTGRCCRAGFSRAPDQEANESGNGTDDQSNYQEVAEKLTKRVTTLVG